MLSKTSSRHREKSGMCFLSHEETKHALNIEDRVVVFFFLRNWGEGKKKGEQERVSG